MQGSQPSLIVNDEQDGVTASHPERAELVNRYLEVTTRLEKEVTDPFEKEALEKEQRELARRLQ